MDNQQGPSNPTTVSSAAIIAGLGYTPANKAGDTFTGPIGITQGTITAAAPLIDGTVTWNNAGVTFAGLKLNVTNTASASASKLIDLQVGAVSQFNVTRQGALTVVGNISTGVNGSLTVGGNVTAGATAGSSAFQWPSSTRMTAPSDGVVTLTDTAGTAFSSIQLGGTTSSFPAITRSTTALHVKLADNTAFTQLKADTTVVVVKTVAGLPTAASNAGAVSQVSDASTTLVLGLGGIVAGGGANFAPVWCDGTNWRYG